MSAAVKLREDVSAAELRAMARESASSTSLGGSCQSGYAIGLTTVIRFDRWYNRFR